MAKIKAEYSCSLILTNDLLGGKWKLRILWHILQGDIRFSQLARAIPDITQKVLTSQLRELENSGILVRRVYAEEVPVRVEYSLAGQYAELGAVLEGLCQFTKAYADTKQIKINDK